jgi:hypothetical protein
LNIKKRIVVFVAEEASVADEEINNSTIRNFDMAGFLLVKKTL